MTNWAQIFTSLLFNAYDGIHQLRTLVFDDYQTCTVPLRTQVSWPGLKPTLCWTETAELESTTLIRSITTRHISRTDYYRRSTIGQFCSYHEQLANHWGPLLLVKLPPPSDQGRSSTTPSPSCEVDTVTFPAQTSSLAGTSRRKENKET